MAIVKCKECGKDVSSTAAACPNCGAAPPKKTSAIVKYGGGFVGALFIIGVIGSIVSPSGQKSTASAVSATSKAAQDTPPLTISAAKLFAEYEANEVAADLVYKGKRLAVKGTVKSIDKDFMDDPVVVLAGPNQFAGIRAQFSKGAIDQLAKLQKGSTVTLTCVGAGKLLTDPVLDCKS